MASSILDMGMEPSSTDSRRRRRGIIRRMRTQRRNFHLAHALAAGFLVIALGCSSGGGSSADENTVTLSTDDLRDRIKGAWAAQTIGVTYGYPVEFKFNTRRVPDDHELPWYDGYLHETFTKKPGVYDDIYMDLTFVQVLEDEGMDAPAQSFANAFANADYSLWFANQVARYNVLNGISPPESGHWRNNPAADDIDFQIEADFAGIMAPGMVNSAIEISDRVGHIMNYGDGWYGGVFIASMYSVAFIEDDIEKIIEDAIDVIPAESDFHMLIQDVIAVHEENPDDWKFAWDRISGKWAQTDLGPRGLMAPFNIDAKINAAWVVLGLLYGDGDFAKTMEIATRAGDDAFFLQARLACISVATVCFAAAAGLDFGLGFGLGGSRVGRGPASAFFESPASA